MPKTPIVGLVAIQLSRGMNRHFFPLLFLTPDIEGDELRSQEYVLVKRLWDVSIFDLYSLEAKMHPLRIPVGLLQLFFERTNLEISVVANSPDDAFDDLNRLRAMFYADGLAPTLSPIATNVSLNSIAGVNARSSGRISDLAEELREGLTDSSTSVEGWPHELSLMCVRGDLSLLSNTVSGQMFETATQDARAWRAIEGAQPRTRSIRHAIVNAPLMPDLGSSILHIWQALEALFKVSTEIRFRNALLLAELCADIEDRSATYENAKKSYVDRSKIAHGSAADVSMEQWMRAWQLIRNAVKAIRLRGQLPSEDALTTQMLTR